MKRLLFFSLSLLVAGCLVAMDKEEKKEENEPAKSQSFTSVMGESLLEMGNPDNRCILIKEGTFFTAQNKIYVYKPDGTQVTEIAPEKQLGSYLLERMNYDNQFVVPYGAGIGLFDLETGKPVIEFDTDGLENPADRLDFKFKDANTMVLTKKAPLGNYTYIFDVRNSKPVRMYQTGYDAINPEGTKSVSFVDLLSSSGYARSFNPKNNAIVKSFDIPGDFKLCTPDVLKLIAGKDNSQGMMDGNIVYDTQTGKELAKWDIDSNWGFLNEACPNNKYFIQVTDHTIKIYDLETGNVAKELTVDSNYFPFGLWLSPDCQKLIAVSNNSMVGSEQTSKINIMKFAAVVHALSKEKQEAARNSDQNQQGSGLVNIWDVNLEAPKQKEEKKINWFW